tara:strand:+ start:300 stop:506 length:207 start_codon:yes stop_codon:yes gene_type:complete
MIEKADIVIIDGNPDRRAIVTKIINSESVAFIQHFNSSSSQKRYVDLNRLTVIQSAKEARKRGRNKIS